VPNGTEPIANDELLYRRIPMVWYESSTRRIDSAAFGPHKSNDATGLSVYRAKYKSAAEAAIGRPGKSYCIAVFRAGDLRSHGIEVVPRPETDAGFDAAHAELPDLNSATRKDDQTLERQLLLSDRLCLRVEGPFPALH
jgi:hypothetical protein